MGLLLYMFLALIGWITGLTPKEQKTCFSNPLLAYFYSLGNINHKKSHKVFSCLIFASISVQMQR
jgi:hypothetical protein